MNSIWRLAAGTAMAAFAMLGGCTRTQPVPFGELPAGSFSQVWEIDLKIGNDKVKRATVAGDQLIVQTERNVAYGLTAAGGSLGWSAQIVEPQYQLGTPVRSGNNIVFPTTSDLLVYDLRGRKTKSIALERSIRSDLSAGADAVYVGVDLFGQGRVAKVDLNKPYAHIAWELMTRGGVTGAPREFQGAVFAGSGDGNVYAVTEDVRAIWPTPGNVFSTAGQVVASVGVDDTGVYAASTDGKLYSLDRATGKIRWQYFAGTALRTGPQLSGNLVYQFVPGEGVVAVAKNSGPYNRTASWTAKGAAQWLAQDAQNAYFRTTDNGLLAVRLADGQETFRSRRTDFVAFAGSGQQIFAATADGRVYAIKPVLSAGQSGVLVEVPTRRLAVGG